MSFNVYTIYNVKDEKLRVKRGLYFLKFGIKNFELVSFFLLWEIFPHVLEFKKFIFPLKYFYTLYILSKRKTFVVW